MKRIYINLFNSISLLLCILSAIVVTFGLHIKHFCSYNDTFVFLNAIMIPGSNPEILIGCVPSILLGFIIGLAFTIFLFVLHKVFPDRFSLNNPKYSIRLLGFSILLFCLCINHMGLELQFVFKNL